MECKCGHESHIHGQFLSTACFVLGCQCKRFEKIESFAAKFETQRSITPDLHSQLEELFDAVWRAERDWIFNDKLDVALKVRRSGSLAGARVA